MSKLEIQKYLQSLLKLELKTKTLLKQKKIEAVNISKLLNLELQNIKTFPDYQHLLSLLNTSTPISESESLDWIVRHTASQTIIPKNSITSTENDLSNYFFRQIEGELDNLFKQIQKISSIPVLRSLLVRHFDFKKCIFFPMTVESIFKITFLDLYHRNLLDWNLLDSKNLIEFRNSQDSHIKTFNCQIMLPVKTSSTFLHLEIKNHYYQKLQKQYSSITDSLKYWCHKSPKLEGVTSLENLTSLLDSISNFLPSQINNSQYPELYRRKKDLNGKLTKIEYEKIKIDRIILRLEKRNQILKKFLENKKCNILLRHQTLTNLAHSKLSHLVNTDTDIHSEKKKTLQKELKNTRCLIQSHRLSIEKNKLEISKLEEEISQFRNLKSQYEKIYHPKFESEIREKQGNIDTLIQDSKNQEAEIKTLQILEEKLLVLSDNLELDLGEIQNNINYTQNSNKKKLSHLHTSNSKYQSKVKSYQTFLKNNTQEIKKLKLDKENLLSLQNKLVKDKKILVEELKNLDLKNPELGSQYFNFTIIEIVRKFNLTRIELADEIAELETSIWKCQQLDYTIPDKWISNSDNLNSVKLDYENLLELVNLFRNIWQEYHYVSQNFESNDKNETNHKNKLDRWLKNLWEQVVKEEKEIQIDFEKFKNHNWTAHQERSKQNLGSFCQTNLCHMNQLNSLTQDIYKLLQLRDVITEKKQQIKTIDKLS